MVPISALHGHPDVRLARLRHPWVETRVEDAWLPMAVGGNGSVQLTCPFTTGRCFRRTVYVSRVTFSALKTSRGWRRCASSGTGPLVNVSHSIKSALPCLAQWPTIYLPSLNRGTKFAAYPRGPWDAGPEAGLYERCHCLSFHCCGFSHSGRIFVSGDEHSGWHRTKGKTGGEPWFLSVLSLSQI